METITYKKKNKDVIKVMKSFLNRTNKRKGAIYSTVYSIQNNKIYYTNGHFMFSCPYIGTDGLYDKKEEIKGIEYPNVKSVEDLCQKKCFSKTTKKIKLDTILDTINNINISNKGKKDVDKIYLIILTNDKKYYFQINYMSQILSAFKDLGSEDIILQINVLTYTICLKIEDKKLGIMAHIVDILETTGLDNGIILEI